MADRPDHLKTPPGLKFRLELADEVFASIDGTPPAALRLLCYALRGGPLAGFGWALDCYADVLEYPEVTGELARLKLAGALREAQHPPEELDELLERLDGITEPPWPALRKALVTTLPATNPTWSTAKPASSSIAGPPIAGSRSSTTPSRRPIAVPGSAAPRAPAASPTISSSCVRPASSSTPLPTSRVRPAIGSPRWPRSRAESPSTERTVMPNATLQHEPPEIDYPARMRLVIDNDSTSNMLGLLVAVRSRTHSADATAQSAYEAEDLTPMGGGAIATLSGASGGGSNNVISATPIDHWQAILSSKILASGLHMTHVGTYRVFARINDAAATAGDTSLRLEYYAGDPSRPTLNPIKATAVAGAGFSIVDLGQVTIGKARVGPQLWEWRILAKRSGVAAALRVDKVWHFPVDEGFSKVVASTALPTPTSFSARDEFDQSAGALTGKTLPIGGTWSGSGDTDDFSVAAGVATRVATGDANGSGRFIRASTPNLTNVAVRLDVKFSAAAIETAALGVLVRYVNASNFGLAFIGRFVDAGAQVISSGVSITLIKVVGGNATLLGSVNLPSLASGVFQDIQLAISDSGVARVAGEGATEPLLVSDSALATGGTLASGAVGIADQQALGTANTRTYDNFAAWVPEFDAVLYASCSAELRSDGYFREDSAVAVSSELPVLDALPRIPPAGMEGRTLEVLVKASRGATMSKRVKLGEAMGTVEVVRGKVAEVRWDTGARSPVPLAWLSDAPGCEHCGGPMEAERRTRKYCSATCRKRAQRCHAKRGATTDTGKAENARDAARGDEKSASAA